MTEATIKSTMEFNSSMRISSLNVSHLPIAKSIRSAKLRKSFCMDETQLLWFNLGNSVIPYHIRPIFPYSTNALWYFHSELIEC